VAIGDSFTGGAPGQLDETRFPDELARELAVADYHNLGVAGATTPQVAGTQLEPCIELRPDLVTVICGANDVLLSVRPDIDVHAAALDEMLQRLLAEVPDAIVVTGTTPDLANFLPLRPRSRQRVTEGMQRLNDATRMVADRYGVLCLEFAEHPDAAERGHFADDGYHPSPEGSRQAARGAALELEKHYGIRRAEEGT